METTWFDIEKCPFCNESHTVPIRHVDELKPGDDCFFICCKTGKQGQFTLKNKS